jgi:hypothetical protein
MSVEVIQIEKSLQFTISSLRERLARRRFAFGALFIGLQDENPGGNIIVMADGMPAEMRIKMLTDLIEAAHKTIEHYRKAS